MIAAATACSAAEPLSPDCIHIEKTSSYWSAMFGDDAATGTGIDTPQARPGRGELFVISGVLRNACGVPLRAAHLAFELTGATGRVVHRQDGYNYGAESLLDVAAEPPPAVVPIAPGAEERFRMILFGAELPPFEHATVRPIGAEPLAPASADDARRRSTRANPGAKDAEPPHAPAGATEAPR